MWSRRKFVFSTLTGLSLWLGQNGEAFISNGKDKSLTSNKLSLLSSQYWSPSISCDFVGMLTDGLCCVADEFGRFIVADISIFPLRDRSFEILGRLDNLGSKVFDLQLTSQMALALVLDQQNERQRQDGFGGQFAFAMVNLSHPKSPRLISKINLPDLSEFQALASNENQIFLAGTTNGSGNGMWFYKTKGKKLQQQSFLKLNAPVARILINGDELIVIHNDSKKATIVAMTDLYHPRIVSSVKLPANDASFVSNDDTFALAYTSEKGSFVEAGLLKNFPKTSSKTKIDFLQSVDEISMTANSIMVLGSYGLENAIAPVTIDKNLKLSSAGIVRLNKKINDQDMAGKLVLNTNKAFVACGWDGIQVITREPDRPWQSTTGYSVPRLPVVGQVMWSEFLVLGGSDLRLYNLKRPTQPELVGTFRLPSTLKEMVLAGSHILCLDQNSLSLRKIDNLSNALAGMSVSAKKISFDSSTKRAYLLQTNSKADVAKNEKKSRSETQLLEVKVYADKIETGKIFAIDYDAHCLSSSDGYVLLGGLHGLSIYRPTESSDIICQRKFPDLAWRDIKILDGTIYATAVDPDANGFFYTMSFDGSEIQVLGATKIPNDGLALSIKETKALCIGQSPEGKNSLAIINLNNISSPKVIGAQSILESACSIGSKDNLAVVVGYGFEIYKIKI